MGARRNILASVIIISVLLNLALGASVRYLWEERLELQSRIHVLSANVQSLSDNLNLTTSEMNYYKKQAEFYAGLVERVNTSEGYVGSSTINIVAVSSQRRGFSVEYLGVTMTATVEAELGAGRILVNTEPRVGIDIQTSIRTAMTVVEEMTGVALGGTDVVLTVQAEQETDVVDGSSAGGCITVALLAALNGDIPDPDVYMTGTVESGGGIGPVGAVAEKAVAAVEAGAVKFLVPYGQGDVNIWTRKETEVFPGFSFYTYEQQSVRLEEYLAERGYFVEVVEVETVEEAYSHFVHD